jgi:hypothetical protein
MAKATLTNTQQLKFSPQTLYPFNFFQLQGLDMYSPDETASPNRCVYGRNFRIFNPGSFLQRSAIAKRQGHTFYSVAIGETVDQQITSTTGAADQSVGLIAWKAQKFTAGASGNTTRVDIRVKNVSSGTGPLITALYSDNSGSPGTLLATSSIPNSSTTSSYQYLPAYYIEAPASTSTTVYWIVGYIQSDGSNTYAWSSTTSATTAKSSADSGNTWASTSYALNIKTYVSTSGGVKGMTRFYRSTASPKTVFAHTTAVYSVNDITGATTAIKTGLNVSAVLYDWANVNDVLYFVNGVDAPQKWDGTTEAVAGGSPPVANNVEVYANHLFYVQPNTNYVVFSDVGAYETIQATSFLYVPSPKTADAVIKMINYGGNLTFLTRNTKYTLYGTDLSSFTLKEATAKKGAVSQSAVCTDQSFIYFMSNDYHIYAYNGGTDTKLSSERVQAILKSVANTSDIKLEVHDKKLFVHYTPTGQTVNHHRLVWDLVFNEWLNDEEVYTGYGNEWNSQSDTGQWIQASSQVGALYYGDIGYNDVGKPIAFDWWSKYLSYGNPAAKHRVKRHYVFLQGEDGSYSVDCQFDEDNLNSPTSNPVSVDVATHKYGDAGLVYGATASGGSGLTYGGGVLYPQRLNVPGQYYKTQFRFVNSGVDQPVDILGWSDFVLFKKPR